MNRERQVVEIAPRSSRPSATHQTSQAWHATRWPRSHSLCRHRLEPPGHTVDGSPLALPAAAAARAVRVVIDDEHITVDLVTGATITVPTAWSTRQPQATPGQRAAQLISEDGGSMLRDEIDEDIGVSHLLGIPEELASAANGSTIHPPHPDAEITQHVAALVLALLRGAAYRLRRSGVGARAG